jgi:heme exporter protein B
MMMSQALAIARKDIKIELRTRELITPMIIFSLMILLSFWFGITTSDSETLTLPLASTVLWITFCCVGMISLLLSFSKEKNCGSLDGLMLCPMDRAAIYFGKLISNFLLILLVNILSLILFAAFFSFDYEGNVISLIVVVVFGTFCMVLIGTFTAGLYVNSKAGKALVPILMLPVILYTVIWPSIAATSRALEGGIIEAISEFRVMGMFAFIFIAMAYLLFSYILEE